MEIALLRTVPIGAAVEISLNVDAGVTWLRLLRKPGAATFAGPTDAATRVLDTAIRPSTQTQLLPALLDAAGLTDGAEYSYCAYGYRAPTWLASAVRTLTLTPTAATAGPDPLDFVVTRLEAGLIAEVAAQRLQPAAGRIPVYTAPPQAEQTPMPVVTVHVDSDQSAERGIGEHVAPDRYVNPDAPDALSASDYWEEGEGWLSRWSLSVIGWSTNPDERNSLRQALKRIVLGNLPLFEAEGMIQVEFSQRDHEDFTSYNVPMYLTTGSLTCLAPAVLTGRSGVIDAVTATATATATE